MALCTTAKASTTAVSMGYFSVARWGLVTQGSVNPRLLPGSGLSHNVNIIVQHVDVRQEGFDRGSGLIGKCSAC